MNKEKNNQTIFMIGVAFVIVAAVIIYMSLSSPKVYVNETVQSTSAQSASAPAVNGTKSDSSVGVASSSASAVSAVQTETTQTVQSDSSSEVSVSYPLNLNTATAEELETISGIGESRAYQIIAYRSEIGGYTSVEQIKDIRGIGDSIYSKVAPYLTV